MTCLVLTKNRRPWLPYAIQCARYQTYPNKEILVVADGDDVADLIPNDPAIRYVHQPAFGSIGAKRNAGCSHARGEIICTYDDDDFSAPGRLLDHVSTLNRGVACSGYHTLKFTDGHRWWLYEGSPDYALGTSLCYWREHWARTPFPDKDVGEDGDFVSRSRHSLISVDAGDLMFATIHGGNTSPRQLGTKQWREIAAPCSA